MAEPVKTLMELWGTRAVKVTKSKLTPKTTVFDDLIAGVELEIENLPRGQGWYMDNAGAFWQVVEDGSLRPRGEAWEFVSKPAPIGTMLAEMEDLFRNVAITSGNYTDRCSVHIHTNVQNFTSEQLSNVFLVYPVFEEILFHYVNHHKKTEEQGYCRDSNLYCIPWSACRMNKKFITKVLNNPASLNRWQKYTALNILPVIDKGSIEWRHMHGTCDMEKLTTWVNIIGAIMRYCFTHEFKEIVKTIKELNDVSTYQQFFREVLLDTLPYDDNYRRLMAEGVVNAKYSLVDWETPPKVKPKLFGTTLEGWYQDPPDENRPLQGVVTAQGIVPDNWDIQWNAATTTGRIMTDQEQRELAERAEWERREAERQQHRELMAHLEQLAARPTGPAIQTPPLGTAARFADTMAAARAAVPHPRPAPRANPVPRNPRRR